MSGKVNSTGLNLKITIQNGEPSGWASFACWYSLNKHLPDAEVFFLKKEVLPAWVARAGVKVVTKPVPLVLPPYVMAVRGLSDERIVDCKEETFATFVRFEECGRFSRKDWHENETRPPLVFADLLRRPETSLNERLVLDLWKEMSGAYVAIS